MSRKKEMIETLLEAFEHIKYGSGEPEELARQFIIWVEDVASALNQPNTLHDYSVWQEAKARISFVADDPSFEIQAELMKAILIGLRDKLDLAEPFVNWDRLNELRMLKSSKFDLAKLIRLCEELNICYANECFYSVATLTRALLDHVPPIFGCKSFTEVCNNYGTGGKSSKSSFREAMTHLDNSSRKIADACLHEQIRNKEALPNKTRVNFSNSLDVLLAEAARVLKE